jgi:DNA-binding CsgD family transcriptional regulator
MNCLPGEHGAFSDDHVRVFGLISAGETPAAADKTMVDDLVAWGFVTLDDGPENRPVALNPDQVARRRMDTMLDEAARRVAVLSALPRMAEQLAGPYQRGQWRAGDGSEYLDDPVVVNARLDDVVGSAEREILSAQPGGPRNAGQLSRSLERDTAALDRGVVKRTLYRATVRDNAVTAEYARTMARRSEYRTLVEPFERCIVVDRKTAFISNHLVEGAPEHSAWQITDRAVVGYIVAEFEAKWRRADPWYGELRGRGHDTVDMISGPGAVRTTRRQREILRDIVAGRAQQATATRLGISLRTLTGEVAELKDLFDASSLPELTYKWALSPDRVVDDSAVDLETAV